MNSNVPHFRSLVPVSCIEIIVPVKIVILSSVRSNKHTMAPLSALCERSDYKLLHVCSRSYMYKGEIVQLQSALNHDYNNFSGKIKHVPHFRVHNWKIFFQSLCLYVHFGAFSLIHSAPQRNAATLREVFAPLSVSHVITINSCSLLCLGVPLSFFLFLNFIAINDCLFNY